MYDVPFWYLPTFLKPSFLFLATRRSWWWHNCIAPIYDRELLWWSMRTLVELTDANVADIDRNGNQSMPFWVFFSVPVPFSTSSSLSQQEKEIKNKLSTDSPCIWATQCWVIERNHSRTCEDRPHCRRMIMKTSARRGSLLGLLLCQHLCDEMVVYEEPSKPALTFPEWVQGKNSKNTVVATKKKVDWAAKKLILDRREKLSLGCCAIGHERK